MVITELYSKKVLVFGLGLLGGGVATANWLIKQGARVTVCDSKSEKELAGSVKKIRGKVKFELGKQSKQQIDANEIIVVNPGVPVLNPLIQYAIKSGKQVENEATLFFKYFGNPIVAVTGTRGKTTTVTWLNHLLSGKFRSSVAGNSTAFQFLKIINRAKSLDVAAVEMPSFHLELFKQQEISPQIAVITNLFIDHVNWHGSFEDYAGAKANIFLHQQLDQILILNADNPGTKFFLHQKPRGHVWFFSKRPLAKGMNGIFYRHNSIYYQYDGRAHTVLKLGNFVREMGEHNLENLLAASLAAFLAGVPGDIIQKRIKNLPGIAFRQEVIYQNSKLKIINDTTATSPEGGIAALKRFASPAGALAKAGWKNVILITGGTDRDLDYKEWITLLPKFINPRNVIFLTGSATEKMRKKGVGEVYNTLEECLKEALKKASKKAKSVVLFSPAAKSFEKFKNEYDRGEQFNKLVRKLAK